MGCVFSEGVYPSSNGFSQIKYYVYTPDTAPRAILQISHGMNEYIGRYDEFARFLCEHGIVVCGNDHAGHGSSALSDDDFGFFADEGGDKYLVEDIRELYGIMRRKYRNLPYFILGHSMGSFVLRNYMVKYGSELSGAIVCGTAGKIGAVGMGLALTSFLASVRGKKHRSTLVKNIAFGGYNSRFEGNTGSEWLSKNKENISQYVNDKRCTFTFTVKAYNDLFRMIKTVNSPEWYTKVPKELPVFIISGQDDPVGNYGKGPGEVYEHLKDADLSDVRLKLYKGDRHEILNETDREEVYADILSWLGEINEGIDQCRTIQTNTQEYSL